MSLEVKYKANNFLGNLEELESFFGYLTKVYSLSYFDTSQILKEVDTDVLFYPKFYVDRIKELKVSFKSFFDSNDIDISNLSDVYDLSIDFDDSLQISEIKLYVQDLTEQVKLKKTLNTLKKKNFFKDKVLINYLIDLEKMLGEKYDIHWEDWLKKYTKLPLEKKPAPTKYSDACFDQGGINFIISTEISEMDRLAYKLQNKIFNDFDSFIETNPLTYVDNTLTKEAEKNLKDLKKINKKKGLKFSDKLLLLADKVDGSKESIDIILENLTIENFISLLEEILKCVPGVLSIEELMTSIVEGSFELITEQLIDDIFLLFPTEFLDALEEEREVQHPWTDGASDISLEWFETIIKYISKIITKLGYPDFFDIYQALSARDLPSSMYEIIKLNFPDEMPDIDFKIFIPEIGQTLEEFLVLNRLPLEFPGIIKLGDQGKIVEMIQKILNSLGYLDMNGNPLKIDGKFGNLTKKVIKLFQRDNLDFFGNPLKINGKIDLPTWGALFPTNRYNDLFLLDTSQFEKLLLDLFSLRESLTDNVSRLKIPEIPIPSFAGFTIPKIPFPNFKNRGLVMQDFEDLRLFCRIYFPEFDFPNFDFSSLNIPELQVPELQAPDLNLPELELPEFDFGGLSMSDPMPIEIKKIFFKNLYDTVMSFRLPQKPRIGDIFDDIFFKIKLPNLPNISDFLQFEENQFFSKLFASRFLNLLPKFGDKYRNRFGINLDGIDIRQNIFDSFLKIPDIRQLFQNLIPEIGEFPSVELERFSMDNLIPSSLRPVSLPDFKLNKIRLPDIPKIPSVKFNLIEFLSDKFYQLILKIVIKTLLVLLARVIDKLFDELCTDPQNGGLENNAQDNGLNSLVGDIACPEKDAETQSQDLIGKALRSMSNVEQFDNSVTKVVEALSVCSTVQEMAPAILGDFDSLKPGYLKKMSNIMKATAPELEEVLGKPEGMSRLFLEAGNLMSPEQRESIENFIDQIPESEIPVNNTICLSKESLEQWREGRKKLFTDAGFDPKVAQELVEKQRDRAKKEIREVVELATKTPESLFSDAIDSIISKSQDPECEDPKRPKELEEKVTEFSNDLLDSINSVFIDDMLVENNIFGDFKGVVSKILSDVHDRGMSEVTNIKENFFLNLLVRFGVIPEPVFPETIFKDLTDNLQNLEYEYQDQTKTTPDIIDKPLFSIPILSNIKQTVTATNYKTPDFVLYYENNDSKPVEYMDYMYDSPNLNGLKVSLDFIKPRAIKQKEFLDEYGQFGFDETSTPKDMFAFLLGEENRSEYENINAKVFSYMKALFSEPLQYGYPEEITIDDIELSPGDNESKTLAQLVNPNDRVQVLDPEIYGGSYEKPNLFVKPPTEEDSFGYYAYSKKLFSDKADTKLDTTILKLSQVSNYIQKAKKSVDQKRYRKAKEIKEKGDILEKPYSIMIPSDKIANVWGNLKILIRVYLAEFFTLGYPVVKKLGIKYENYGDLLFSYIENRINRDMQEMKDLGNPKSIYSPFIIYCLLLESLGIQYITEKKNEATDYLEQKKEEYTALFKEEISYIKSVTHNSLLMSNFPEYASFVKGFSSFSFQGNWSNVLQSTTGFDINSFNLDEKEIRLASKIGYILGDIDFLRDLLKEKIIEEAKEYENIFKPEINNIYADFISSPDGLNIDLSNIEFESNSSDYYLKKYIKVTEKNGNEFITDYVDLLQYIDQFSDSVSISTVLGNAEVEDIYERKYSGTIGIKLGVSFGFNEIEIERYEKDIKDLLFSEVKSLGENLGEDILCYVDELLKTPRMLLLFKHCLKVEKVGSLAAIYFMKNGVSSLGEETDEREKEFDLFGSVIESIFGKSSVENVFPTTKKEVLKNINTFLYDEERDPKDENTNFTDFKKKETIKKHFDSKNIKIKGEGEIPIFSRNLIKNDIQLDADGNPIVNKFLSTHFSED